MKTALAILTLALLAGCQWEEEHSVQPALEAALAMPTTGTGE